MKKNLGMAVLAAGIILAGVGGGAKEAAAQAPTTQATGADAKAKELILDLGNKVTLKLVEIPAGKFLMGSPEAEKKLAIKELGAAGIPEHVATDLVKGEVQHEVTISKPFMMGIYEVTQGQWKAVMGDNPSCFKDDDNLPVEQVSWNDAMAFCRKLSEKEGRKYRLPTEAEWEYACRAGSETRFNFGDKAEDLHKHGNYCDKLSTTGMPWQDKAHSDGFAKTAPVGSFAPSAWGLYDMHGNVWEWCSDWHGDYPDNAVTDPTGPANGQWRVLRGGSWDYDPCLCRAAYRLYITPVYLFSNFGFRVVLDSP